MKKFITTAALSLCMIGAAALPAKATTWTLVILGYTVGTGTANGTVGPLTIYHIPTALFSSLANCQAQIPFFTGTSSAVPNATSVVWSACLTAG